MSSEIINLQPNEVWKHFHSITQIPRPSKKEERIIQFMIDFGKKLNLETLTDEVGNVLIRKPASPGYENRKGIILQTHLDMVPQKNSDTKHDFEKDPIQAYVDGEWVKARGTTLGSDNGMGVAATMALLESTSIKHGPIEAFFTIDEETGMTGAFGLKPGFLKGEILINLDSEDEGELYIGCAGGMDAVVNIPFGELGVPEKHIPYKISIKGLKGGHSGLDINLGRGNSNKLLFRFLNYANDFLDIHLSSVQGGNLRNAIPREAFAVLMVPDLNEQAFLEAIASHLSMFRNELKATEPDLVLMAEKTSKPEKIINPSGQVRIIKSVYGCPNGAIRMSDGVPGLVETSNNLAVVQTEAGNAKVLCLMRSSVDSAKEDVGQMIRSVFELAGASVELAGGYPGWKPNPDSPILKTMSTLYQKKYGKVPEIKAIHAGLECGLIGGIYPAMDMISCGPTIRFPHSPDEKVHIESVGKFWDFLVETVQNIPAK
jgi:dipeptidase D